MNEDIKFEKVSEKCINNITFLEKSETDKSKIGEYEYERYHGRQCLDQN